LRQPRDLAGAVEHEGAADEPLAIDVLVRHDAGDAGAHGPLAALELAFARDQRRVADAHAAHVGDGVERARRIAADRHAEVAQPFARHAYVAASGFSASILPDLSSGRSVRSRLSSVALGTASRFFSRSRLSPPARISAMSVR